MMTGEYTRKPAVVLQIPCRRGERENAHARSADGAPGVRNMRMTGAAADQKFQTKSMVMRSSIRLSSSSVSGIS